MSQVPNPPSTQMIAVAVTNRVMPSRAIKNPSTSRGIVLAIR